jgi:hypothetical protein
MPQKGGQGTLLILLMFIVLGVPEDDERKTGSQEELAAAV